MQFSIKRLFQGKGVEKRSSLAYPTEWLVNSLNSVFGYQTKSGQAVNPRTALSIASVHACVRVIADGIAGLSLKLYYDDGKQRETIVVHSPDWSQSAETVIQSFGTTPPRLLVSPALPFTPAADYIVDAPYYPTSTDATLNQTWKGLHAFFSPNVPITAGISQTVFEVGAGDIAKFLVGAIVRINNFDFSDHSLDSEVIAVDTVLNRVEIDSPTGFTINNTHECRLVGFADGGYSYRYI